jgi:hypothetical protein
LQIGKETLVAEVDLRRETHEEQVYVESLKLEDGSEAIEPELDTCLESGGFAGPDLLAQLVKYRLEVSLRISPEWGRPAGESRRLLQNRVDFLFRNVETRKTVVRRVEMPGAVYVEAEEEIDELELREDMLE